MKLLSLSLASTTDAPFPEPRGFITTLRDEPSPGFIRHISLGAAGLIIRHGDQAVAIPLSELLRAAESAEPDLAPPRSADLSRDGGTVSQVSNLHPPLSPAPSEPPKSQISNLKS